MKDAFWKPLIQPLKVQNMELRKKTLVIIGLTLASLIGAIYGISSKILLDGFAKVEKQDTQQNVNRVQDALSDEIAKLDLTTTDWAQWDDTYTFIEDINKTYLNRHLSDVSIARLELNLMLYVHSSGRIVAAKGYDLEREQEIPIINNFQKHLAVKGVLQQSDIKSALTGIILLPEGPLLISSRPILNSQSSGPIRGTLIMGRFLNAAASKRLAEKTHLSVTLHRFDAAKVPQDFQALRSALLSAKEPILVRPLSQDIVAGYTSIKDIYGRPALIMRVDIPRVIYKQGQASIRYLILAVLVVGLVFIVATLLLLEQLILSRLSRLSADVYSIGTSGDLSKRVLPLKGKDELSSLGSTINEMLIALEHSLKQQRESEDRHYRYNKVLAELAKNKMLEYSDIYSGFKEIAETSARTLAVERTSIWLFNQERSQLNCVELYERSAGSHAQGMEITAISYPAYFKALSEERVIAVHDVHTDPRTKELIETYSSPLKIVSLLDAPIWVSGQTVGAVCHESLETSRHWSLEEQNFVASIADLVSLVMEASERKRSQQELQKAHDELEIRVKERTSELAKANEDLQAEVVERKIAEAKLIHDAFHDSLTGLPNRALFMERLERVVQRAKRLKNYLFAVLFLDLDRFKLINDSLGHLVGDQLLIAFARRLGVCRRSTDTVARLGGDEFAVLLDDIKDINHATIVAERVQKELTSPFNLDGHEIFISASIGIALSTTGYDQPEEILRDADTVMYRAKALGKARHEVFDKAMHARAVTLLRLENDLRRALERQELEVYYQPIVSLKTGITTGFEALIRWQNPNWGAVSPADFIPLAEETGLIVPIGYWVLREACSQMRSWQEKLFTTSPLTISINFSGRQFSQPDLIKQIARILQETGLDARSLKLEITESILIDNPESAAELLSQLRSLGVEVYIDDFGTGYSSLSYLHRLPIDALKIDRSFISRMCFEQDNLELVRTIITMAHNLNMSVVAEGIETIEQLTQLKTLQCECGQGYFFSKPLTTEAAGAWIDKLAPLVNSSLSS